MKKVELKNIVSIQAGYPFRGKIKPSENGVYRIIQGKDISNDGMIQIANLTRLEFNKPPKRYLLEDENVVFLAKSNRNVAAVIHEKLENTIAANSFFILKCDIKILLPGYLAWYLNQDNAQNYLKNNRSGVAMPIIGKKEFEEMKIEIPRIAIQKVISELYWLSAMETQITKEINEKRRLLILGSCLNALKKST